MKDRPSKGNAQGPSAGGRTQGAPWGAIVYAAIVLGLDALAFYGKVGPVNWGRLHWQLANGADLFKFSAWFVIPFAISLRGMDWGYFGVKRWRRVDIWFLAGLVAIELGVVLALPLFPGVRSAFPPLGRLSLSAKWAFVARETIWNLSWILGWEFLHRYFLLRAVCRRWPRFGWLIIPVFEGAYHLTWPTLWMPLAMVGFSLVATPWALKRRNALLPFLAHLAVELELTFVCVLS